MRMLYKDALMAPDISWNQLTETVPIPSKLYKYQNFYTDVGKKNPFWEKNMNGQFHLSLGCEFEDINDCKPYISKTDVIKYLVGFFEAMGVEHNIIDGIIGQFETEFTDENINGVIRNYQNEIRIGCFTDSFQNNEMWENYADNKKGFCIEYDTRKHDLFYTSILPVFYTSEQYNLSMTYAYSIILECCRKVKQRDEKEQLSIYRGVYEKIIKTAYIPLFLKEKEKWCFEHEYRMFILKNRNTTRGMLKMDQVLDKNYNINLSDAINAIYLGKNFYDNENSSDILRIIKEIAMRKKFLLYRMEGNVAEKICIV